MKQSRLIVNGCSAEPELYHILGRTPVCRFAEGGSQPQNPGKTSDCATCSTKSQSAQTKLRRWSTLEGEAIAEEAEGHRESEWLLSAGSHPCKC